LQNIKHKKIMKKGNIWYGRWEKNKK